LTRSFHVVGLELVPWTSKVTVSTAVVAARAFGDINMALQAKTHGMTARRNSVTPKMRMSFRG
jgi:hypothetical protein